MAERETAIITGAASGIGRATVERLAKDPRWNTIYAVDKDPSIVTVFQPFPNIVPFRVDVRSVRQIDGMLDRIIAESGAPDLVVNAAGVIFAGRKKPLYEYYKTELGRKQYLSMFLVNVSAVLHIMNRVEEAMKKNGKGTIVNITTSKRDFPDVFRMEYMEDKQLIEKISLDKAKALRKDNVRVVVVKPGNTKTDIDRGVWIDDSHESEAKAVQGFNDWWRKTFGNDPKNVAEVIYNIAKGKIKGTKIYVGFDAKLGRFLVGTIPGWRQIFFLGSYAVYEAARLLWHGKNSPSVKTGNYDGDEGVWYQELEADLKSKGRPQDLIHVGEKTYARMDAGVSVDSEQLKKLGITFEELEHYRHMKHQELDGKTRALVNCQPDPDGDWKYSYKIEDDVDPDNIVIMGKESVIFNSQTVFDNYLFFGLVG